MNVSIYKQDARAIIKLIGLFRKCLSPGVGIEEGSLLNLAGFTSEEVERLTLLVPVLKDQLGEGSA